MRVHPPNLLLMMGCAGSGCRCEADALVHVRCPSVVGCGWSDVDGRMWIVRYELVDRLWEPFDSG